MTTIAYDGKALAADRLHVCGDWCYAASDPKMKRVVWKGKPALFASAGDTEAGQAVLNWINDGAPPDERPTFTPETLFRGVLITRKGPFWVENALVPFPAPTPLALGTGQEFALAAMYLGKTAAESIEVATALNSGTGGGVDVMTLSEARNAESPMGLRPRTKRA